MFSTAVTPEQAPLAEHVWSTHTLAIGPLLVHVMRVPEQLPELENDVNVCPVGTALPLAANTSDATIVPELQEAPELTPGHSTPADRNPPVATLKLWGTPLPSLQ